MRPANNRAVDAATDVTVGIDLLGSGTAIYPTDVLERHFRDVNTAAGRR